MNIITARSAGFCFGVRRAVDMVEALQGEDVVTYGPLIHNPQMVERLCARGVGIAYTPEETAGRTAVIRSHGAAPDEHARIRSHARRVIDATCPCVQRIYGIVRDADLRGLPVLVIGEADHPEVIGTRGHASDVRTLSSEAEAMAMEPLDEAIAVAQTTFPPDRYERMLDILRQRVANLHAHRTTCDATQRRQREAIDIAKRADAMVVVGGRNSSNTRQLVALCREYGPVYAVETAKELPRALCAHATIGVTAGASTPDWILKEVLTEMTEMDHGNIDQPIEAQPAQEESLEMSSQDSFQEAMEKTLVTIRSGHTVSGVIVQVTEDEVCVNIGYKSDGLIPRAELSTEGDPRLNYHVGDEIEVEVVKVNDGEGNVLLSQKNIVNKKNWDALVALYDAGAIVEGEGKEVVKGGLIANVMGIRTFIPASQLSDRYVEKMNEFVGQPLRMRIIEMDGKKRRLVASRKAVLLEERDALRAGLWEKLHENEVVHGVVRRLTDFGAFVDIGGLDGLVHVTDLSWGRVKHPSDVVSIGQEIDVLILSLDREKERISLGLKHLQSKPWDNAVERYPVDSIVTGTVVRIVTFGAFVELEQGLDGLVHISQIADERVNKVEDKLRVGDVVRVKVLDVNPETKRISLSIREAKMYDAPEEIEYANEAPDGYAQGDVLAEEAAVDGAGDGSVPPEGTGAPEGDVPPEGTETPEL